jgi:hypothetical protein
VLLRFGCSCGLAWELEWLVYMAGRGKSVGRIEERSAAWDRVDETGRSSKITECEDS